MSFILNMKNVAKGLPFLPEGGGLQSFRHALGPGGYKATIPLWRKKEQELQDAGIPDPLEGYTLHTRNWI
jgi:hypothetical protein